MNRNSFGRWSLLMVAILVIGVPTVAVEPVGTAHVSERGRTGVDNFEGQVPTGHITETVISLGVDPVGTFTESSVTFDCASCYLGFGTERWDFTVTVPTDIRVEVSDCCVEGDRFEARCNNRSIDEDADSDLNNHEEDCIFGREEINVPVGTYANIGTVTLDPGDWTVRIRDVQFQCGTVNPGCGAGYTMRITFLPPSGTSCAGIASCFNPANPFGLPLTCADESLPRDEPIDMIEAKLDALDPQIVNLEQKLDLLQIQIENIIIALEMIEAKLDDPGPTPCDMSDPGTCDGVCPMADDICVPGVGGAPCTCVTPCDQSDPLTCDGECPVAGDICTPDAAGNPCTCVTPCDLSDPATCGGECPTFGDICQTSTPPGGPCTCVTPCDQSDPATCGGVCPIAGEICTFDPAGCTCARPCDQSDPLTCDGICPTAGEVCTPGIGGGPCSCTLPCDQSDPATCGGDCPDPTSQVCTIDASGQQCFCDQISQDGFCDEPGFPCTPCTLGTVCFDGTPCGQLTGCP